MTSGGQSVGTQVRAVTGRGLSALTHDCGAECQLLLMTECVVAQEMVMTAGLPSSSGHDEVSDYQAPCFIGAACFQDTHDNFVGPVGLSAPAHDSQPSGQVPLMTEPSVSALTHDIHHIGQPALMTEQGEPRCGGRVTHDINQAGPRRS